MTEISALSQVSYRTPTGLDVTRLQPAIGAEISSIDLTQAISPAAARDINAALLSHGVIFFRDQKLDYAAHRRLALSLGEIMTEVPDLERSEVLEVRSRAGSREGTASSWHSDGCYMAVPPAMSILRSLTVPPLGGDTCFSSAAAAYEDLSDDMKRCIGSLRYTSSAASMFGRGSNRFYSKDETDSRIARYPDVTHPVVRVHPETGRPAIYVNELQSFSIVGLENPVGEAILRYLCGRLRQPEYQVRWRWTPHNVAIWDNRAVQHYGVPDQTGDRHMERIMVAGTAPFGLAEYNNQAKS